MVVPKKGKRGPVSEGRCHVTLARDLSRPLREIAGWGGWALAQAWREGGFGTHPGP